MNLKMLCAYFLAVSVLRAEIDIDSDAESISFPVCMPTELVEGMVSVVTGKVYNSDEDLVIAGVEPIHIYRFHLNLTQSFRLNDSLFQLFWRGPIVFE